MTSRELRRGRPAERDGVEQREVPEEVPEEVPAEPRRSKRPPREELEPAPTLDRAAVQRQAEASALARLERPVNALLRTLADRLHELVLKAVMGELGTVTAIGGGNAAPGPGRRPPRRSTPEPSRGRASAGHRARPRPRRS